MWSLLISVALAQEARGSRGFAVVELYTSQGCSSCPPAEVLLSDLVREGLDDGIAVYALAFHVPWWDSAAWKDPWAEREHAQRQERYGQALGLASLYTPQVVINGRVQVVGSDVTALRSEVARALVTPAAGRLTASAEEGDGGVWVQVAVEGPTAGAVIGVALVQDGLGATITGGENQGRALQHDAVVRALVELPAAPEVRAWVPTPLDLVPEAARLVVWLQRSEDRVMLGATGAPYPLKEPATTLP